MWIAPCTTSLSYSIKEMIVYFSWFMGNELERGTNRSREPWSGSRPICLFHATIDSPWAMTKRHSFLILTMLPTKSVKHLLSYQPFYIAHDVLFLENYSSYWCISRLQTLKTPSLLAQITLTSWHNNVSLRKTTGTDLSLWSQLHLFVHYCTRDAELFVDCGYREIFTMVSYFLRWILLKFFYSISNN